MEENLSHELLRQDPNPNLLHVYGITTSENTSYLPPFLNPQLNVPFIFPFLCCLSFPLCERSFSMLFMNSINVTDLLVINLMSIVMANLQSDENQNAYSKKTNASTSYRLTVPYGPTSAHCITVERG